MLLRVPVAKSEMACMGKVSLVRFKSAEKGVENFKKFSIPENKEKRFIYRLLKKKNESI